MYSHKTLHLQYILLISNVNYIVIVHLYPCFNGEKEWCENSLITKCM